MKIVIAIDVQNDFVSGSLGSEWAQNVTPKIIEYIKSVKDDPNYVVFATRDTHKEDYLNTLEGQKLPVPHCIRGTFGWNLVSELNEIVETSRVINKPTFMSTELPANISYIWSTRGYHAEDIGDEEIEEIILVGFCTSICVVSNALNLRGNWPDKKITVIENLCGDIDEESHKAALKVMQNCQIDIVTL